MKQKKIILAVPHNFGFLTMFEKNLRFHGYEVVNVSYNHDGYSYKNVKDKIINFYRKTFMNDKNYKNNLRFEYFGELARENLANFDDQADYALIVRSDMFPFEFLQKIAAKSNKMISYQWDGVRRYPYIKKHIDLYDRFFVFEKDDVKLFPERNLKTLTNFYFDFDKESIKTEDLTSDVFFIGSFVKERQSIIENITKKIVELGFVSDTNILWLNKNKAVPENSAEIKYFLENIPYEEALKKLKKSRAILDFLNTVHTGLSFRTFEAMYYHKKLITNNETIVNYDFYNPENIFVFTQRNYSELKEFLTTPYKKIPDEIYKKYSFENWIRYVLGEKPNIRIEVP